MFYGKFTGTVNRLTQEQVIPEKITKPKDIFLNKIESMTMGTVYCYSIISKFYQFFIPGLLNPAGLFALYLLNILQPKYLFQYLSLYKTLSFNKIT